jgi:hypothetical protein
MSSQPKHSRRTVPTHRSAWAVARGARYGVGTNWASSERTTSSNARGNLASRSRTSSVRFEARLVQIPGEVVGLLGDLRGGWVRGAASDEHSPRVDVDEEQHVEGVQPDGLDREEVACEHRSGVGAEESSPGEPDPAGRRRDAAPPKSRPDRGDGDVVAQLEKLAADAQVAPTGVLRCEPADQVADLRGERQPARTTTPTEGSTCAARGRDAGVPASRAGRGRPSPEAGRGGELERRV